MNLLKVKYLGGLFKARWFPIVPQLVMLTVFGLLVAGGIGVTTDDGDFARVLRNTNLANLLVWSYWWPIIIIAAVLLGRMWCMVCPVELVTYWASRIGLRLQVPLFFKSGWVITLFYMLILLVGIHTLAIHRIPQRMALYLLMLTAVAVVVSLIFQKRAFCSYVCPVGHLLGLYAFVSPFEWRVDDASVCKSCKTKDCFVKKNHYRAVGRSCTSNLYPATIKNNKDCLLCTQCLKACPYDNLRFSTRWPFADFFRDIKLKAAQVGFILLVSGFVVYEVLSEWPVTKGLLKWLPDHLVAALGITGSMTGLVSAIVMFILFPALLFAAVAGVAKIASVKDAAPVGSVVKTFALLLLPTMAGAHIIKALLKMTSRIPYWPHALSEPKGVAAARGIIDKSVILDSSAPNALYPAVSFMAVAVLLAALGAILLVFKRSAAMQEHGPGARVVLFVCGLAYWGVFAAMILLWRLF